MIEKKLKKIRQQLLLTFCMLKKKKLCPAYISKHNSIREKQVILLTISNGEKQWHYPAVKKLSALLTQITSKHHVDFYCLKCLHFFATEKKNELHKKVCENEHFCNVIMPSEDNKLLQFNQYQKSDKAPVIISADLE